VRYFIIEVLDTAEQITPEKAFDILTFSFRGEVLRVSEPGSGVCVHDFAVTDGDLNYCIHCGTAGKERAKNERN
jgi:hypothetical protein